MLDGSLQFPKIWQNRLLLTAGVRNILDVKTVQQSGGGGGAHSSGGGTAPISPGRSFFVRASFNLSL